MITREIEELLKLVQLRELADVVQLASLCGLGQAAPLALRALEHFPESLAGAR